MLNQHVARQINDRAFERRAHFFLQLVECAAVGEERLIDWCFGRQDRQLVACAYHRPFDEQSVDAAWIVDGVGQTAPRFKIKRQRAGAEMNVEIKHRG